ncbi:MAG: flagellar filament capping protein FliD, partial [Synergistaceae bacterium]|nr:flagellar filament capping protein FliD [Synergistaceae bacterium]
EAEGKAAFTLTDSDGNVYEYGKDFALRSTSLTSGTLQLVMPPYGYVPTDYSDWSATRAVPRSGLTLTYNNSVSRTVISSETVEDALGFIPSTSNYSKLSITDIDGNAYTEGTDYNLNQLTGEVTFISTAVAPKYPTGAYTLTYVAAGGEALTTDGVKRSATDSTTVAASDLDGGTTTITYGNKTYYEGIDFNIGEDSDSNATVEWIPDSRDGYEWYYPTSGAAYTINHTDDDGNTTTYSATRTASTTLSMSDYGMTTATGSISVQYGDDENYYKLDSDGDMGDGRTVIKATHGIDITPTTGSSFTFNWAAPTLTSRSNLPSYGTELTVQYEYDANTFDLADDCDGELLYALGFTKSDGSYDDYTAAQNAILRVDDQTVERDSNDIGADYENELIKGVTMHLKGTGTVSLDISHDAEKAVEAIQTFVDNYNDLMTWMNTRMTEKQVDEDTAATIDSDDFRMRWGLLHGNSLLRQTKTQMRNITSQNFTFSFTQRKSSEEVYGTMAFNGLKTSSTLRLRIGTKYVDVTIDPTDTLETIVAKINDDTKNGPMHNIYYDDNGNKLATPLLRASVENDMLVINSTSSDEITMSGSAAMNALKMNYTYKGLYQIGIESTSDDYGKSGELVFDSSEFMEALEDNPDEVQALMLKFVDQFGTWTRSMLNSSASGETSGTLTREIENIQSQIDNINEYLEKYQERLDRMEENLRTRYANTETSLAKLNQQASAMASILQQLSGTNNNNNSSS